MLMVYVLWVTFVFGGAYMGFNAVRVLSQQGFELAVFLNAVVYLGIALYGVPKLYKFVFRRG